jgi:hypothetical protein
MTPVENPARALALAMLELAIEDYVTLREIGAVSGTTIDEGRWNYEKNKDWRYRPLGYGTVQSVQELIEFLSGQHFELLCDYVSTDSAHWQAWQFRRRIGLVPVDPGTRLLGTADLWWTSTPRHMRERMVSARTGKDLEDDGRNIIRFPAPLPTAEFHDTLAA